MPALVYGWLNGAVSAIGLLAAVWFLIRFRPRRLLRAETFDPIALPVAVALATGRVLVLLAVRGAGDPRELADALSGLIPLALIDVIMIYRLVILIKETKTRKE